MPRTTAVESPGCPPLRALTCDVLGLVKVIEAPKGEQRGAAKVVEKWGEPDATRCVLAASLIDRETDPLLGAARKNGAIEVLSPINGEVQASIPDISGTEASPDEDPVVSLHMFKEHQLQSSPRSCSLLICTNKGNARIVSVEFSKSKSISDSIRMSWKVCGSGSISCSKVDHSERYALFGGKGVEVSLWDLEQYSKLWMAKYPAKNSLGIFTPTWFTSVTFLNKDDHRKFVAGTSNHQVRLYDVSSQRRPVMSLDFRETPIKALVEDQDGHTVYIGNGSGDLASVDIRTGKLLGCFTGKCSGSIRSIARHPDLPIIASCGLDSYLRIWDAKSRQLLSAVFLKQPLTDVVFDSYFRKEESTGSQPRQSSEPQHLHEQHEAPGNEDEEAVIKRKRKKGSKSSGQNKKLGAKKYGKQSKSEDADLS